jgi:hypothetical protein
MTEIAALPTRRNNGPSPELIEQVVIKGDLSALTPAQRSEYYAQVCSSLGLNPLTKPFDYLTLKEKEGSAKLVLYAKKDCTDQLRQLKNVSVQIVGREQVGEIYLVTARAVMPNGRLDESVGAVTIANLRGDYLANALMKAETKAKRRVTLSICGLGLLDESELEEAGAFAGDDTPAQHPQFAEPQPAEQPEEGVVDGDAPRVVGVRVAKTGKNTNGEWRLYVVKLSNDKEYTTFSETVATKAKELLAAKVPVSFEADDKGDGKLSLILIEAAQ